MSASMFQTRLLTGIGRYNEMIYVFDVLKQNHQFELLLGKGMEKVSLFLNMNHISQHTSQNAKHYKNLPIQYTEIIILQP